MTTTASEIFQLLVQKLRQAELNFHLTETPYSAQILIRKRFLKDKTCPSPLFFSDVNRFQNKKETVDDGHVEELQKTVQNSNEMIDTLKSKVAEAERQTLKIFEDNKTEISLIKNSLKKSENENKNFKKVIDRMQKEAKEKEKAVQKLELKSDNLNTNLKNLKTELTKLRNENKKLLKSKVNIKQQEDDNKNIPPASRDFLITEQVSPSRLCSPPSTSPGSPHYGTPQPTSVPQCTKPIAKPGTSPGKTPRALSPARKSRSSTTTSACSIAPFGPSTPLRQSGIPAPTSHSPCTPPGFPEQPCLQPACDSVNEKVVEDSDTNRIKENPKSVLSKQVQEVIKEGKGKVDFKKLLEAVKNDEFFCGSSANSAEDEENYEHENHPDNYWEKSEIHDINDKAVGELDDDMVL